MNLNLLVEKWSVLVCWTIATVATLGSLFFSEVMLFPPCVLCWYQRIAMYPLVVLLLVGMFQPLSYTLKFAFPIVIIGWIVALYHNLLHFGIVPDTASPCREGVSCASVFIDWFGFITIPMLSFVAFSLLLTIIIISYRSLKSEK